MTRHRVAQVGLGRRGRVHVEAFLANAERFDLVAICDLDEERLRRGIAGPLLWTRETGTLGN